MKTAKTKFQEELDALEDLLVRYKAAPPQNVGMLFRENLSYFLMLMSIFFGLDYFFTGGMSFHEAVTGFLQDTKHFSSMCCIAPILFVFGVIIWNKSLEMYSNAYRLADTTDLLKEYERFKKKYAKYPDIQNLLAQYNKEFVAEKRRKTIVKVLFRIVFWGFFCLYGYWIYKGWSKEHVPLHNYYSYNDDYCEILHLEPDKPFLTIEPFKTDVTGLIKLRSGAIDIYLNHSYTLKPKKSYFRSLCTAKPEMAGNAGAGKYRLTITNEEGQPIDGCPDFVFDAAGDNIIYSNDFPDYAYSIINKFQALHTLKYLQDNKEHLRYLVERL